MSINSKYMYKNQYFNEYIDLDKKQYRIDRRLKVTFVDRAIILPAKRDPDCIWGAGGGIDEKGNFVKESRIRHAFGKAYSFNSEEIREINEDVIYIPCIPNHWGHFLLDVVSRLWYVLESTCKIAFCISGFPDGKLIPNIQEFFELLGCSEDRLIAVDKPVRFRRIMIPEPALLQDCEWYYHPKYMETIDKVKNAVLQSEQAKNFKAYQKIYFTRTKLKTNWYNEAGEKIIEDTFRKNGFQIFSPELLSLSEQIFLISNCREIASLSGTIPHNIVFADKDVHFIILSRTAHPNSLQVMFNHMTEIDYTIIDVYHNIKKPSYYGSGPFWVEYNNNLKSYMADHWENAKYPGIFSVISNRAFGAIHYCIGLLWKRVKKMQILKKLYHMLRGR